MLVACVFRNGRIGVVARAVPTSRHSNGLNHLLGVVKNANDGKVRSRLFHYATTYGYDSLVLRFFLDRRRVFLLVCLRNVSRYAKNA